MSLAINSLILFFLLIFPGIVFRRFYYTSEFSKQFVLRDPFRSFVSNIVPGILLQSFCLILFHSFINDFDVNSFLDILLHDDYDVHQKDSIKESNSLKTSMVTFVSYETLIILAKYVSFLIGVAIVSARIIRFVVRKFKLDVKIKLLRFQNEWHYLFKGEIRDFNSFKSEASNDVDTTYIDILAFEEESSNTILYTGLLTDYSLCPQSRKLEHIYLTSAKRYDKSKKPKKGFQEIPGDIFVIPYAKVENFNLRYQELVRELDFKRRNLILGSLFVVLSFLIWSFDLFLLSDFFDGFRYLLAMKVFLQLILISVYTISYTVYVYNRKSENKEIDIGNYRALFYFLSILLVLLVLLELILQFI